MTTAISRSIFILYIFVIDNKTRLSKDLISAICLVWDVACVCVCVGLCVCVCVHVFVHVWTHPATPPPVKFLTED